VVWLLPAVPYCSVTSSEAVSYHPTSGAEHRGLFSRSAQRPDSRDTGSVFRLFRPSDDEKLKLLTTARETPVSSPHLLTLADGALGTPPKGFVHDLSRTEVGRGLQAFDAARHAFRRWQQFDLGWVQVLNPSAEFAPGQLVGVEVHTVCLWSMSLNRIVETVDSPSRFGFMYATTALHVEQGQERFVIEFDPSTEAVSYLIEAVSRPRHPLASLAYPFSRAMQRRFARDSHARLRRYILG
jgi:uncharacterized protein (UPF0548 family)